MAVIHFRGTPDLKRKLAAAAEANDCSMSAYASRLLERSFLADDTDPALARIRNLLVAAFHCCGTAHARRTGHPEWTPDQWLQDPECYREAMFGAMEALLIVQPPAEVN